MHREEPRAYTVNEVRELFLQRIWQLIEYWDTEEYNQRYNLEGLAFSILAELDGESDGSIPGFAIIPMPHLEDEEYNRIRGDNWFPSYDFGGLEPCDIGGSLHEFFYEVGRKKMTPGTTYRPNGNMHCHYWWDDPDRCWGQVELVDADYSSEGETTYMCQGHKSVYNFGDYDGEFLLPPTQERKSNMNEKIEKIPDYHKAFEPIQEYNLKPCPFCGDSGGLSLDKPGDYQVHCWTCGASSTDAPNANYVIWAWNRRLYPTQEKR